MFAPQLRRLVQSSPRPLQSGPDDRPLPAEVRHATVRVWLHALDGDGRSRSESRKLVRTVAAELGLGQRAARQLVKEALRNPGSLQALRDGLTAPQRVHLLRSAYALARANGRLELFDRLSAPLIARWLGLAAIGLEEARVAPEVSRTSWLWRAA